MQRTEDHAESSFQRLLGFSYTSGAALSFPSVRFSICTCRSGGMPLAFQP